MTPQHKKKLKWAIKYGRITGLHQRPEGHGGSRGNGAHLSSNASPTSEASRREEAFVKKELHKK